MPSTHAQAVQDASPGTPPLTTDTKAGSEGPCLPSLTQHYPPGNAPKAATEHEHPGQAPPQGHTTGSIVTSAAWLQPSTHASPSPPTSHGDADAAEPDAQVSLSAAGGAAVPLAPHADGDRGNLKKRARADGADDGGKVLFESQGTDQPATKHPRMLQHHERQQVFGVIQQPGCHTQDQPPHPPANTHNRQDHHEPQYPQQKQKQKQKQFHCRVAGQGVRAQHPQIRPQPHPGPVQVPGPQPQPLAASDPLPLPLDVRVLPNNTEGMIGLLVGKLTTCMQKLRDVGGATAPLPSFQTEPSEPAPAKQLPPQPEVSQPDLHHITASGLVLPKPRWTDDNVRALQQRLRDVRHQQGPQQGSAQQAHCTQPHSQLQPLASPCSLAHQHSTAPGGNLAGLLPGGLRSTAQQGSPGSAQELQLSQQVNGKLSPAVLLEMLQQCVNTLELARVRRRQQGQSLPKYPTATTSAGTYDKCACDHHSAVTANGSRDDVACYGVTAAAALASHHGALATECNQGCTGVGGRQCESPAQQKHQHTAPQRQGHQGHKGPQGHQLHQGHQPEQQVSQEALRAPVLTGRQLGGLYSVARAAHHALAGSGTHGVGDDVAHLLVLISELLRGAT